MFSVNSIGIGLEEQEHNGIGIGVKKTRRPNNTVMLMASLKKIFQAQQGDTLALVKPATLTQGMHSRRDLP